MTVEISETRMTVRLPDDAVAFLDAEAKKEFTSRNAQIVRAIRERMQATAGDEIGVHAPAVVTKPGALESADLTTQG